MCDAPFCRRHMRLRSVNGCTHLGSLCGMHARNVESCGQTCYPILRPSDRLTKAGFLICTRPECAITRNLRQIDNVWLCRKHANALTALVTDTETTVQVPAIQTSRGWVPFATLDVCHPCGSVVGDCYYCDFESVCRFQSGGALL
jgi:hypothetical protein